MHGMEYREKFMSLVEKTDDCWLWKGPVNKSNGCGQFYTGEDTETAQRAMWKLHYGAEAPRGKYVVKTCKNKLCVNPEHLAIAETPPLPGSVTGVKAGAPKGEANGKATVSDKEVELCIEEFNSGTTSKSSLSRKYGVAANTVGNWISGRYRIADDA